MYIKYTISLIEFFLIMQLIYQHIDDTIYKVIISHEEIWRKHIDNHFLIT